MKDIFIFIGTRPEAIKMAPIYRALKETSIFRPVLVATGQHKEMLRQALSDFCLTPDCNLEVMSASQSLAALSARLFERVDELLSTYKPDAVLVQGDTTTVQIVSQCAFYRHLPLGHVEAGLRSRDMYSPFPEEFNRRVAALAATWHFAPTAHAAANLRAEGVPDENILITGNPVIDALLWMLETIKNDLPALPERIEKLLGQRRPYVLITGHRRESFGQGFQNICRAIVRLSEIHPEVDFIYPVHLNPNIRQAVWPPLSGRENIILTEPLPYKPFIRLMAACRLIVTDSGGIQEEGPSLGKPVLIMREVTERPEGLEAGVNRLIGTDPEMIVRSVSEILTNRATLPAGTIAQNPFGDGQAAYKIAAFLATRLSQRKKR